MDAAGTGGAPPRRIVILGNAGSGKSTLARRLGAVLDLPVVHLDRLFWEPGWTEPDPDAFRARVRTALEGDAWVCEGNYSRRTFDLRLPRADLVIWLDTPRLACLARVVWRSLRDAPRPDRADRCAERFDRAYLGFLNYVWTFDRVTRPRVEGERIAMAPAVPVVRLRSRADVTAFVAAMARGRAGQPPTCVIQSAKL